MKTSRFVTALAILSVAIATQWCLDRAYARAMTMSGAARREFREFPAKVGNWQAVPVKLSGRELELLAVDDCLRADFSRPDAAGGVSVYAGYYRNPDRATQHPPTICYPGSGWLKTYEDNVSLAAGAAGTLKVSETVFESGQRKVLVIYWYEVAGFRGADASRQKIVRLGRLLSGKGVTGGLKVQMSLAVDTTREEAEGRLGAFLADFLPALKDYSPRDIEEGS